MVKTMNPHFQLAAAVLTASLTFSCGKLVEQTNPPELVVGHDASQEALVRVGECLAVQIQPQTFVTFADCLTERNLWRYTPTGGWESFGFSIKAAESGIVLLETAAPVTPRSIPIMFFSDYPFEVTLQAQGKYSTCQADFESHDCYTEHGLRGAPLVRKVNGQEYLVGLNAEPEFLEVHEIKIKECPGGCRKQFSNAEGWGSLSAQALVPGSYRKTF